MREFLDLESFPLDRPDTGAYSDLVARCRSELGDEGMCSLPGFFRPAQASAAAKTLLPLFATDAFRQQRHHNIYFDPSIDLPPDHPVLQTFETRNLTLCADQLASTPIPDIYAWPPLKEFLARIMGKDILFKMDDPLACVNVMSYGAGDRLSWHFDRSEFTTTLLLQAPNGGGEFEYRTDLRTEDDPNFDGVARLLAGADPGVRRVALSAGTLNIFRGVNTPHRVTPITGDKDRIIAVFSYFDRPGKTLTTEEQTGFYGRSAS